MKNLIIISVSILILSSCKEPNTNVDTKPKQKAVVTFSETPRGISVQVVNGCQYVYVESQHGVAIVHAGNCNNMTH